MVSRSLSILTLVLASAGPLPGQGRSPEPLQPLMDPYVCGCAHLLVDVSRTDRTPVSVRNESTCGPLRLVLAGEPRVSERVTPSGERYGEFEVDVPVAERNTAARPVRAPVWIHAPEDRFVAFAGHKQSEHVSARYQFAMFEGSDARREEFGEFFDGSRERMWRLGLPGQDISVPAVLSPGEITETKWVKLRFWRNPADSVRVAFGLRSLRPAPPLPAAPPAVSSAEVVSRGRVVPPSPRFPAPIVGDAVVLRYRPGLSRAARQLVLDRVGGRVLGIVPRSSSEPDYILEIEADPSGTSVLKAVLRLRAGDLRGAVGRAGILLAAPPVRPDRSTAREILRDTTLLAHPDIGNPEQEREVRRRVIRIRFEDATPHEQVEALDLIGGHVLASADHLFGTSVEVIGTAADAEQAKDQVWWLPQVRDTSILYDIPISVGSSELWWP